MVWCVFESHINCARPSQPFLKNCQNGTFYLIHAIQKCLGPNYCKTAKQCKRPRLKTLSTNKYAILNWKTTQISLICWLLRSSNSSVASSIAHWSIDWREWPMTASITSSIQKIPIWERLARESRELGKPAVLSRSQGGDDSHLDHFPLVFCIRYAGF